VLRPAWGVQPHERVLDVGCGSGQTTCEAARLARAGSAVGIDVAAPAIERARELARAQGIRNVTFERADAQVHPFPQERFDLATSRFGTMFFADPVAAFGNIGRALRPAGRLVMMVWQAHDRNEWEVAIRQSLANAAWASAGASVGADAFSLADPPAVTGILTFPRKRLVRDFTKRFRGTALSLCSVSGGRDHQPGDVGALEPDRVAVQVVPDDPQHVPSPPYAFSC